MNERGLAMELLRMELSKVIDRAEACSDTDIRQALMSLAMVASFTLGVMDTLLEKLEAPDRSEGAGDA